MKEMEQMQDPVLNKKKKLFYICNVSNKML